MHTKNLPALFELLLGFSVQLFKETHSSVEGGLSGGTSAMT